MNMKTLLLSTIMVFWGGGNSCVPLSMAQNDKAVTPIRTSITVEHQKIQ